MKARFYANDHMTCMEGEVMARYLDGTNLIAVGIPPRLKAYDVALDPTFAPHFVVRDDDICWIESE